MTRIAKVLCAYVAVINLVLVLAATSLLGGCNSEEQHDDRFKIGITQIATHQSLDTNRQGFLDRMTQLGFVSAQNVEYDVRIAELDTDMARAIAKDFVTDQKDLIFCISTRSTEICAEEALDADIPIVFGSVSDPALVGLVETWNSPGRNTTGVSEWLDMKTQIDLIKLVNPDITRIGTLYNHEDYNSMLQVDGFVSVATDMEIAEVVKVTVTNPEEVLSAIESLVTLVDAVWLGTDQIVENSLDSVVRVCKDNRIPLFSYNVNYVKAGAIAGLKMDFYEVGVKCAEIAARILNGEDPGSIPVYRLDIADVDLFLNVWAAEQIGLSVAQNVLDMAQEIIQVPGTYLNSANLSNISE